MCQICRLMVRQQGILPTTKQLTTVIQGARSPRLEPNQKLRLPLSPRDRAALGLPVPPDHRLAQASLELLPSRDPTEQLPGGEPPALAAPHSSA